MFKLLSLLEQLANFLMFWQREALKKELTDATDKALSDKDQRPLEEALGGSADTGSVKYDRMYERPRTKKD